MAGPAPGRKQQHVNANIVSGPDMARGECFGGGNHTAEAMRVYRLGEVRRT